MYPETARQVVLSWSPAHALLFGTLLTTSLCAWLRWDLAAWGLGVLSLGVGLGTGHIRPLGAAAIAAFAALNGLQSRRLGRGTKNVMLALAHGGLALALYDHRVPGFTNWQWLEPMQFRTDGSLFVSYLNTDKILVGSLLLLNLPSPWASGARSLGRALRAAWLPTVLTVLGLMAPAVLSGHVRLDLCWHPLLPLWTLHNLVLVVLHEEVMFRFLLPKILAEALAPWHASAWATLGLAAAAFGGCHYRGGLTYVVLATLAGLGYGWASHRARGLAGSIFAHFCLNAVHFVFFTYPSLARLP